MNIIVFIIMTVAARSITRYQTQKPIRLYSKTGRHLTISKSGSVGSTIEHDSSISLIKMESTGHDEFVIKSVETNLYLSAKRMRKSGSKSLRLRATSSQREALRLSENVMENNFNQYSLKNNKNCKLAMRSSGKFRILCNAQNDSRKNNRNIFDFLPRRVHNHRL